MRGSAPSGQQRDVVVVGGSAGALDPLKVIVADVPADLGVAMLVVLHLNPASTSNLSTLLNRVGGLRAVTPQDGDPLLPGYMYVGAPDRHLDLSTGVVFNSRGRKVNGMRPAIDVLFQSAAAAFGPRTIAVLLSGGLGDGSAGLVAVREAGGVTIVQNPDEATVPSMPRNAIEMAAPDHVVGADEIGALIAEIAGDRRVGGDGAGSNSAPDTVAPAAGADGGGGAEALWAGVRSLEEQAAAAAMLAKRARKTNDKAAHGRYAARKELAMVNAQTLRRLLRERD